MLDLGKDSVVVGVRKPRLPVLVAGLVLVLAGCSGGDPEPKMAPTESVASTPSTSAPTVSPSVDPLSPEETVRAWVKARNAALQDGDTAGMHALAASGCDTCEQHSDPIERVYAHGGHFSTPGWTIDRLRVARVGDARASVHVAMTMADGETVPAAGEDPVKYSTDHRLMVFKLTTHGVSGWTISFIGYFA